MMYAMSNERETSGATIAGRRAQAVDNKYAPRSGENWQGRAWGLASTKVGGRQNPKATRFGSGSRGELYYGQKRELSTDLPPDDPGSFLSRGPPPKAKLAEEALLEKARQIKESREVDKRLKRKRNPSAPRGARTRPTYEPDARRGQTIRPVSAVVAPCIARRHGWLSAINGLER